ncbi:mitochondrial carrier domain-containing protein [Powellomyces hirtus]|nr:mitochondrial carrier domain-containing protein [Powellomyces hirtus]
MSTLGRPPRSCLRGPWRDGRKSSRGRSVPTIVIRFYLLAASQHFSKVGFLWGPFPNQPFDTVKVRLQTQPRDKPTYSGMGDCVKQTLKNEGFAGFYKGTLTPLIGVGACVAIQFGALETAKRELTLMNARNGAREPTHLTMGQLFVAGAASGIANSVLSGPIEHVRTRLQVQSRGAAAAGGYSGPLDFARKVASAYGVSALYKGQCVTLVREFVGYGSYFSTYEWLMQRAMIEEGKKRNEIELWKQCAYGATAGYALWLSVYPIDVVKSKLQTDGFEKETRQYRGMVDCARKTLAQEGMKGLYRGFWACMARAAPVNAATFVAYEATMNLLGR